MSTRLVSVQCRQQDDCIVVYTVTVSSSGLSRTVSQNQVLLCPSENLTPAFRHQLMFTFRSPTVEVGSYWDHIYRQHANNCTVE